MPIRTIAFDADDTLWANETIFNEAHERCKTILSGYVRADQLEQKLYETEIKNLKLFGYGVKGFTLSMIESAIDLSRGRICGEEIQQLIDLGKFMIQHPVEVLEGVTQTLKKLEGHYQLICITKGDLFDQETKMARSGIGDCFARMEVVSEKKPQVYQEILTRRNIPTGEFLMVGNSLRSDVLPIVEIGAQAVHIPFHSTWAHETVDTEALLDKSYYELKSITELPALLQEIDHA